MPFFLISWSLSVEEHFYLFLPLVLAVIWHFKLNTNTSLVIIIVLSMSARLIDPYVSNTAGFGYSSTATHLNISGLLLGVYLAYLSQYKTELFNKLGQLSKLAFIPVLLIFLCLPLLALVINDFLQNNIVVIFTVIILLSALHTPTLRLAKQTWVKNLALWSYSVYLTHAIVINAYVLICDKLGIARWLMIPLCIVIIMLVAYIAYKVVEQPSMAYRERWIPKLKHR